MTSLEFFDFNSDTSEEFEENVIKCNLQNEDTDTVLELKKYIARQQGIEAFDDLQIFWQCIPLEDNILAKELLDKPGQLFVGFPQYPSINCDKEGGNTIIFWKTLSRRQRWLNFEPGQTETINVPRFYRGHFGVLRSQ